jgi:N-acetyl-anhydromuramyl-L-alanine amidase AmpD
MARAFEASAARAGVDRDLLVAIAAVEDGLSIPAERLDLDEDNDVPAAGPMQLRRGKLDTLARGASLVGATELDLRVHADLALEAGALVLAELGRQSDAREGDIASYSRALEELSGFADDAHREHYAHQVFATLARGGRFDARDGEVIVLPRHDLPPSLTLDVSTRLHALAAKAQYPGAEWIPTSCSNKCTPTREGNAVKYVVIHDTEGGWNASVATLQNDPGKSVQYIVGTDGKVGQFVTEETTAWHAGNYHFNQRSVGIEHVGYSTKPYAEAEYAASAKLVGYLTKKYKVPGDRAHVIGHDQIPNGDRIAQSSAPCSESPKGCAKNQNYGGAAHHTDPGVWEWPTFMHRFGGKAKCNDVTNLWNCSNDKKQAFRCVNNQVEVATCEGACVTKPDGADDVCNVKPQSTTPPGTTEPPETGEADTTPQPTRPPPVSRTLEMPPSNDAGCTVNAARGRSGTLSSSCALLLAMAGLAVARGRRENGRRRDR